MDEIEKAFRFMTTGKHMGKVMIQVRKEEPVKNTIAPIVLSKAYPRCAFIFIKISNSLIEMNIILIMSFIKGLHAMKKSLI